MAMKTKFPTINLWTTQSSLYSHETWGGVWEVIDISSYNCMENFVTASLHQMPQVAIRN